jgi:hypothetical protein
VSAELKQYVEGQEGDDILTAAVKRQLEIQEPAPVGRGHRYYSRSMIDRCDSAGSLHSTTFTLYLFRRFTESLNNKSLETHFRALTSACDVNTGVNLF